MSSVNWSSSQSAALRLWSFGLVLANLPFAVLGVLMESWVMCVTVGFTTIVCLGMAADARKRLEFRVFFCICFTLFWWVVSIVAVCLWVPTSSATVFTQESTRQILKQTGSDSESTSSDSEPSTIP